MEDFDDCTAFLGQWGRFQQVVFFLLCASIFPNGFSVFSLVFLADVPDHRCLVPELNLTEDWQKAAIPTKVVDGSPELSSCSRYRLDVVRKLSAQGFVPGRDVNVTDLQQEACLEGWSYSSDVYSSTIVSEFDLVCSDQWKHPFTATVYFFGVLVGSFFSGQLSDRFGRKPVLFATMAVQTFFSFAMIFSPSWTVFCILLFMSGLGQVSNYIAAFVLGTETLSGQVRVLFSSMGVCLAFAFGYMMLPLLAYFFRDWRSLLFAVSLVGLIYLPLWWFIPESPMWLLSQGRVEEADAIVRKAAKWNDVKAPHIIFVGCAAPAGDTETQPKEHHSVFSLLKTSNIRNTTFVLCLVWFTVSISYYGLSLNTSRLHANRYLSCFISAAVEVPAYVSSWLALRYLHRQTAVISILLLGGLSLYVIPLVPQSLAALSITLEMVGKFGITSGTSLMFAYTAELYPTVIRNTATGTCTMVSRVGSCLAPFLLQLSVYFKYLPHVTLGTLSVASAFAALFLPESFGQPLPQTIQQMHRRKRISCPFAARKEKSEPAVIQESKL